jgi:hypothetical protein
MDDLVVTWKGIQAHRFVIPPSLLYNETLNPANAAYRMNDLSGVLNISLCSGKAPVLVSKPHFLGADPAYAAAVQGIEPNPNPDLYDTRLDVETLSGVVVVTNERLQVNLVIEPVGTFFPRLTRVAFPVLWVDKTYNITESQATALRDGIAEANTAIRVANVASIVGACIGTVIVLVGLRFGVKDAIRNGLSVWAAPSTSRVPAGSDGYAALEDGDGGKGGGGVGASILS